MSVSVIIAKELFFITLVVGIVGYYYNKYSNNIVINDKNTPQKANVRQIGPFRFSYN